MHRALALLLLFALPSHARTWTNASGAKIEADYVSDDGTKVTIKRTDGATFAVPLASLSAEDRAFVADLHKPAPAPVAVEMPLAAVEAFPAFDFGLPQLNTAQRGSFQVHRWGLLEVLSKDSIERPAFEKAMRPLLGANRILQDLGYPKAVLLDEKQPLRLKLLASEKDVAAAIESEAPLARSFGPDGYAFATLEVVGLGSAAVPLNDVVHDGLTSLHGIVADLLPEWFALGVPLYGRDIVPWENDWPQPARAHAGMKRMLASVAAEKKFLITLGLIEMRLSEPDLDKADLRAASQIILFYLRHLHGDGKGTAFKAWLTDALSQGTAWRDYQCARGSYNSVWAEIKADPTTVKKGEGRYLVPSAYTVPEVPTAPSGLEALAPVVEANQQKLLALLGPQPGITIVNALRKAGFTDGLAEDSGAAIASTTTSSVDYKPVDLTPDYAKAAPAAPRKPLAERRWPDQFRVDPSDVKVQLVSSTDRSAIYRVGRFEFHTGPKLAGHIVAEMARSFLVVEELVERLPWELKPTPANGSHFVAKLYKDAAEYRAIAPPSSGGFYSLKEKVFHVPYESLSLSSRTTSASSLKSDTLMHELTHMMMDSVIRHLPIWVTEGSAEYVETIPYAAGAINFGKMPEALATYVSAMRSGSDRDGRASFVPSTAMMIKVMHMSRDAWHDYIGAGGRLRRTEPAPPTPPTPQPPTKEGFIEPPQFKKIEPPVVTIPRDPREINKAQRELYMHACLLFYYFLHLDSPANMLATRGDPMLPLLDKAATAAPQWKLYEDAADRYQAEFDLYKTAWEAFSNLPGVTKTGGGNISYPRSMTPPTAPESPRTPVDISKLPDKDIGLANLDVVIKGRTDDQLQTAFREAFAKLGITL